MAAARDSSEPPPCRRHIENREDPGDEVTARRPKNAGKQALLCRGCTVAEVGCKPVCLFYLC